MARAHLFILDSFGIGSAPDAAAYGDEGSDTFGHIVREAAEGRADRAGLREGPLRVPNMLSLGLAHAHRAAGGEALPGMVTDGPTTGLWTHATEHSAGKDTPSGHWEIAGVPVSEPWHVFPPTDSFPHELIERLVAAHNLPGTLGHEAASGTEIIARLGDEHVATGKPILYTSADSVLQIAAHEETFGLDRLLELCRTARAELDRMGVNVGRVIARPFVGGSDAYERTANRHDFAVPPPEPTLLDRAEAAGRKVIGVGKIADIFAHRGVTDERRASGNEALTDTTLGAMEDAGEGDLVVTNFVDFDMLYGHRRDVPGYAAALEAFDRRLPELQAKLRPDDMMVLTADHGCDPTWRGTDHTRERVPVLISGPELANGKLVNASFSDIGETVSYHLGLTPGGHGRNLL